MKHKEDFTVATNYTMIDKNKSLKNFAVFRIGEISHNDYLGACLFVLNYLVFKRIVLIDVRISLR